MSLRVLFIVEYLYQESYSYAFTLEVEIFLNNFENWVESLTKR